MSLERPDGQKSRIDGDVVPRADLSTVLRPIVKPAIETLVAMGPFKLYKTHSSTSTRANFFSERIINVWNALPTDVVDFSSLFKFRSSVLKLDLSRYIKRL